MILNYTEIVVKELFEETLNFYIKKTGVICTCKMCRDDILASTLNCLPPHYVTSQTGMVIMKATFNVATNRQQVISTIIEAIYRVSKKPNHTVERI